MLIKYQRLLGNFVNLFKARTRNWYVGIIKVRKRLIEKTLENTNFEIFRKHEDTGSFLVFNWMKTSLIIFKKNTYLYNFLNFYLYCQTLPIPFKQLPIVRIKPLPYPKYRNSVLNMNPFQFIIEKFAIQIPVWM